MASNIAYDKMFASMRVPAWHKLGQTWDEAKSPLEALEAIGGNFTVHKQPLKADVPVLGGMEGLTVPFVIENRVALMREPIPGIDDSWAFFGVAGPDYEVVQNRDVARWLEPLAEEWPVETVGLLGKGGEEIFMTLSLGDWDINGEQVKEHFLIHNGSTGNMGLTMAYTPVRVVCQNTLTLGLSAATVKAKMSHRAGVKEEAELRMKLTADLQKAQLSGREAFMAMADAVLNTEDVQKVLADLFPMPKKPRRVQLAEQTDVSGASEAFLRLLQRSKHEYDVIAAKQEVNRENVATLFDRFNDEYPQSANTAWGLYNVAVEYADHRPSKNGEKEQASSALFGGRAKEKEQAFKLTYAFAR